MKFSGFSAAMKSFMLLFITIQGMLSSCSTEVPGKPNILLIITDDQGYGDLSIHGNPHVKTPNIDKLGQQSVRFDHFYVSSVRAPTRASILTGMRSSLT